MNRMTVALATLMTVTATGLLAQQNPPADTARQRMMRQRMEMQGMRAPGQTPEQIRAQIEERWGTMVQTQLGLTDQQADRVRTAERANQDRHRDLNRREEDLMRAVRDQLQPGVAANNDSLARSLDALAALRVQQAQSDQQLLRDLAFLSPVQRARYLVMARRFRERVEDMRRMGQRQEIERGMRPGPGPGPGMPGMRQPRPLDEDL